MTEQTGVFAGIIQIGDQLYLTVLDDAEGHFHRFPITTKGCARLASECAWVVNGSLGGFNPPLATPPKVAQRVLP